MVNILVSKVETRIYESQGRHYIFLQKMLVVDSQFPFKVGEKIIVEIVGDHLEIRAL